MSCRSRVVLVLAVGLAAAACRAPTIRAGRDEAPDAYAATTREAATAPRPAEPALQEAGTEPVEAPTDSFEDGTEPVETEPAPHEGAFLDAVPGARAVFVGRLIQVGSEPAVWSGRAMATQWLRYEVVRVLTGDVAGAEVTLHQLVVSNGPLMRADHPGLRDEFVALGREYAVLVGDELPGLGPSVHGDTGIARATPSLLERIERLREP